jgi:hypothetical protein
VDVFNERAGVEVIADFSDSFGLPTIPPTAHWRLDCDTTGVVLQDSTEVTPTAVTDETGLSRVYATVNVPGSLNAIQNNRNSREKKTLWIIAAMGTDREFSEVYEYWVMNRRGRT